MAERRASLTEPRIENLLEQENSKFTLVTLASRRAREINDYYNHLGEGLGKIVPPQVTSVSRKPLSIALEEIEVGKIIKRDLPTEQQTDRHVLQEPESLTQQRYGEQRHPQHQRLVHERRVGRRGMRQTVEEQHERHRSPDDGHRQQAGPLTPREARRRPSSADTGHQQDQQCKRQKDFPHDPTLPLQRLTI